ncbi:ribosome assembly cofactor RimP [Aureivirga sp. CE67]|uniref:ribosome assembly cofactor RimP n=1 Tax=Aureivirga sp. CE67 TaxID=1788983 RepID=UPI0018C94AE1|nr:ribosome assembly cofactor RimP [Aureivirga sp. CE67]
MDKAKVKQLVEEALNENPSLFLIELSFLENNKIHVEIDGDEGVPLKECIRVSRNVEHNLDREEEDFALEVTTPDIANPIQHKRQYKKNLNRTLEVKYGEDNTKVEGKLVSVTDDSISLEWKAREPKPIGKGKVTVVKNATILYSDIHQAKVKIIFN